MTEEQVRTRLTALLGSPDERGRWHAMGGVHLEIGERRGIATATLTCTNVNFAPPLRFTEINSPEQLDHLVRFLRSPDAARGGAGPCTDEAQSKGRSPAAPRASPPAA
jgi:hypothetical protein